MLFTSHDIALIVTIDFKRLMKRVTLDVIVIDFINRKKRNWISRIFHSSRLSSKIRTIVIILERSLFVRDRRDVPFDVDFRTI